MIDRIVRLWSNPGDVVFTPFMGVGSEVFSAVMAGRRGVGAELKASYYRQAVRERGRVRRTARRALRDQVRSRVRRVQLSGPTDDAATCPAELRGGDGVTFEEAVERVRAERERVADLRESGLLLATADEPDCPDVLRLAALVEEVGEVARAIHDGEDPYAELVQVAGIALGWIEGIT